MGLAIGFLAKGHTVFLFTLLPLLVAAPRALRPFLRPTPLLVFLLPVLPWFLAIQMRYPEFLAGHAGKFADFVAEGAQHHRAPIYVYVGTLALGLAPFTLGLRPGIRALASPDRRLLLAWLLLPLVALTLIPSRSWTYILPAVPAVAVLGAAGFATTDAGRRRRLRGLLCIGGAAALLVASTLAPPGASVASVAPLFAPLGAAIAIGGVAILAWRSAPRGATAVVLAYLIGIAVVDTASRVEGPFKIHRRLARRVAAETDAYRPLVVFDVVAPSFSFYLDPPVVVAGLRGRVAIEAGLWGGSPTFQPEATLEALLQSTPPPRIILREADRRRLAPEYPPLIEEGDLCLIDATRHGPREP